MKTIDKKIEYLQIGYEENCREYKDFPPLDVNEVIDTIFRKGVEWATRWISVEVELPETHKELLINSQSGLMKTKPVLVKYRNGQHAVACRCQCKGDSYMFWDIEQSFEQNNDMNIIAWRPIEFQ